MRDKVWRDKDGYPRTLRSMNTMQQEHRAWRQRNFPGQVPYQPILGAAEEVGELAHAYLKMEQGIRGTQEELDAKIDDAIGDLCIYLFSFCNMTDRNLLVLINKAWDEVRQRNWILYPTTGRPQVLTADEAGMSSGITPRERALRKRIEFLEHDLAQALEACAHWEKTKEAAFKQLNAIMDLANAPILDDEEPDAMHGDDCTCAGDGRCWEDEC